VNGNGWKLDTAAAGADALMDGHLIVGCGEECHAISERIQRRPELYEVFGGVIELV